MSSIHEHRHRAVPGRPARAALLRPVGRPAAVAALAVAAALAATSSQAQAPAGAQPVRPPVAQGWIDLATFSGMGNPMGALTEAMGNPMQALGNLFGGGGAPKNAFGRTSDGTAGRWVDVTLALRDNPSLAQAQLAVPPGFLTPALTLQAPPAPDKRRVPPDDEQVVEPEFEKPKGKLLLYWGCGPTVRQGQPRVLDFATMTPADAARFFVSRQATQRGTHAQPGRPVWPNPTDARMVPAAAMLAGDYAFTGAGVPESFRFQLPPRQEQMPALAVQQRQAGGATELSWTPMAQATGWFLAAMGTNPRQEMVLWTSSEQPDTGFGLIDYQTNGAVDRWVREKILLEPRSTGCTVPAGVFEGGGAMLRVIAYGSELNLAHPPRPADPKQRWEPEWTLKVRNKSVSMLMLGMDGAMGGPQGAAQPGQGDQPGGAPPAAKEDSPRMPGALDLLRGVLGR